MKKHVKKIALAALAGVIGITTLTGCSGKLDGTKTVATVDGTEIPLGEVSFMMRYQQAQTASMYASLLGSSSNSFWDEVADEESGETYGEQTRDGVLEEVELMYLLQGKAKDYGVEVTDEEKKAIDEAAKSFMEANTQETIAELGVTQEHVAKILELSTIKTKIYDPIVKDVDTNVSDEEAAQTAVTYVGVSTAPSTGDDGKEQELTDEEKAQKKEQAQAILDQVLATADADMDAIAKQTDESLSAAASKFTTNSTEEDDSTVPQEVKDAVKDMQDGEVVSSLVEGEDSYYIVRLDKKLDEEATENKKTVIINDRKQDLYTETTDKWKKDAEIKVDKKVLKTLKLTGNHAFSFKQAEATETPEATEAPAEDSAEATETPAATDTPNATETPVE